MRYSFIYKTHLKATLEELVNDNYLNKNKYYNYKIYKPNILKIH